MKEGLASQWAQNFMDQIGANNNLGTWTAFEALMDATFKNVMKKKEAQRALMLARQTPQQNAEAFFVNFDNLVATANYGTGHDEFLVNLLETAVDRKIIDQIYA
jgi:hypothetical protein